MIPLLALGIPGSSSAAIVLGALTLHGVSCGPLAFTKHSELIYLIFAILFVANIFMVVIERGLLKGYIRLLSMPRSVIMTVVMMMCIIGSYAASGSFSDVYVFVLIGTVGYVMKRTGFSITPVIMGYILSDVIEENFIRALSISKGDISGILSRPIALVFLAVTIAILANCLIKQYRTRKVNGTQEIK